MSEMWGIPSPLQIGGPKTSFFRNLAATLMACIFGMKHDIDNRASALATRKGLLHRLKIKRHKHDPQTD